MKIVRDKKGHICQINMDDGSDIPKEEFKTALDFISKDEKELTIKFKEKCKFWEKAIPNTIKLINDSLNNFSLSETDKEHMSLELDDLQIQ